MFSGNLILTSDIVNSEPCIEKTGYSLSVEFPNGDVFSYMFKNKEDFLTTYRRLGGTR